MNIINRICTSDLDCSSSELIGDTDGAVCKFVDMVAHGPELLDLSIKFPSFNFIDRFMLSLETLANSFVNESTKGVAKNTVDCLKESNSDKYKAGSFKEMLKYLSNRRKDVDYLLVSSYKVINSNNTDYESSLPNVHNPIPKITTDSFFSDLNSKLHSLINPEYYLPVFVEAIKSLI